MRTRVLTLEIDGKKVKAREGMTILEAASESGIKIPSLCYHEKLSPYGACRLCTVEIESRGRKRVVAACGCPVEEGLIVRTSTPGIEKARKLLIELMARMVGGKVVGELKRLAEEYAADVFRFIPRFGAGEENCVLCGLCYRYCEEALEVGAIGLVGRGIERRVVFLPEIATTVCMNCRKCFELCPTGKLSSITDGVRFEDFTTRDVCYPKSRRKSGG